jgi:DNA-binding MarR family transcriptional regulator
MSLINFPKPDSARPARASGAATAAAMATLPRAAQTPEDTGLPLTFLVELVGKCMFQLGLGRLGDLAQHLGLSAAVVEAVCQSMRRDGLVEVARRGQHDSDVVFDLTQAGRNRAGEWLLRNQYVGPAPVSLEAYAERVRQQSAQRHHLTERELRAALADLIVPAPLMERLGVAMNSTRPILFYGPPGAGKTYLAEQLQRLLGGPVAIPHAIYVHGEVIRLFDAHWHHPVPALRMGAPGLDNRSRPDGRWVLCERPVVVAGGELTLQMLDLSFDARAGYYEAPPHFKANNGLFIVDDLGRQVVNPQDLMNRWIVPMERHYDYLMLRNGGKFQIPFDQVLVFSTNLKPEDIADPAFLRRLGHKIEIGPLDEDDYRRVFEAACAETGVPFDGFAFHGLLRDFHAAEGRPLLACNPRDLLQLVVGRAAFLGIAPAMTASALEWAWNAYFAGSSPQRGTQTDDRPLN